MSEIIPGLFIGNKSHASSKEWLDKNKITHIVNTANELPNYFPSDYKYMRLFLYDNWQQSISQHFNNTAEYIDKALNSGGRVLIHCHMGRSRSGTILINYLMHTFEISYDEAFKLVQSKHREINPNQHFVAQLKAYY